MVAQGAFRLIFPRPGKQRTGEGAGAFRGPALIVSPAWPGNGRGKRGGAGRARWLVWRGLAKQAPCADSRPQRRGRRQRGPDRCAASPTLPSPCSLPFSPFPFYFSPSPLRGLRRFAPKNRAGRSSVRCAQAASPDRFSWRRPRFCRFAPAAWAAPSRAKAGQTKNGRLARWRQPAVTGSSDAGAGVSWRSSWPLPRLRFPSLSPLVPLAGGGGPRTGSRS